jgi:ABC-2 type transport system ATP-binding protein
MARQGCRTSTVETSGVADPPGFTALEARAVGKRYGATWALRAVDLAVPAGSITALVGPNGAGKSTLMKAWMAFERPTAGAVAVMGIDPWIERRRGVGMIGYVPQQPALYRDLSLEDHLTLARSLRPAFDAGFARGRLRSLGIRLDARPTQLSGGEQAQAGLAIALGTNAPVLLLDEPLASLDPLARRQFLSVMLESVRADGRTVVLSSHIITDVDAACDRVVVLSHGTKLLDGSIAELRSDHEISAAGDAPQGPTFVSTVDGADGEPLHVLRARGPGRHRDHRPATLEEIVIAYLIRGSVPTS